VILNLVTLMTVTFDSSISGLGAGSDLAAWTVTGDFGGVVLATVDVDVPDAAEKLSFAD
jgi:hypothetical protein